ncbi:hypothetical protein HL658_08160 [Azospirillum sp. RWY-5-1]|uniref:DUF1828 domain-containing protein n=1 Tax=Azospirillum oleiclasticum TaxID=2735135 RepID=A0ABX2T683_9PROT|nr:hypothetical protein [Azospirillum oleiclasticum]NYZ12521.1 hypothetical protein [Azospirillum oleiclasticum]NYZ19681.1 hypothetical protein [Azospirillum oleiclasticum]
MNRLSAEEIEFAARSLIEASETSLGIEVNTPIVYPNGDCVTVVVEQDRSDFVVHDGSFGAMYLAAEGIDLSKSLSTRLSNAVGRYGCEMKGGRVVRRAGADELPIAIALVANASRLVGDQVLEMRRQSESEFRVVVTEKLRNFVGDRLRENQEFKGKSGRLYRVANVILDSSRSKPVAFVMAITGRHAIPAAFSEMFDLKQALPAVANDSVYPDDSGVRIEDANLLNEVGRAFAYSKAAEEFSRFAQAAE